MEANQRHRIYIKIKDIIILEGIEKRTACRRMKCLCKMYECRKPTIGNYASYNGNSEEYIIKKMSEMKLI